MPALTSRRGREADGYEATRRIKADPTSSAIPIIAVTSYALSGDEEKARAAGCDDFVPKPYSRATAGENPQVFTVADVLRGLPRYLESEFPDTDAMC